MRDGEPVPYGGLQTEANIPATQKRNGTQAVPYKIFLVSAGNDLCVAPLRQGAVGKKEGTQCRYFAQEKALSVGLADSSPGGRAK